MRQLGLREITVPYKALCVLLLFFPPALLALVMTHLGESPASLSLSDFVIKRAVEIPSSHDSAREIKTLRRREVPDPN